MDADPVVTIADRLADDAATYRFLFQQVLNTLRLQQQQIDTLQAQQRALREELHRYVRAAMVGQ